MEIDLFWKIIGVIGTGIWFIIGGFLWVIKVGLKKFWSNFDDYKEITKNNTENVNRIEKKVDAVKSDVDELKRDNLVQKEKYKQKLIKSIKAKIEDDISAFYVGLLQKFAEKIPDDETDYKKFLKLFAKYKDDFLTTEKIGWDTSDENKIAYPSYIQELLTVALADTYDHMSTKYLQKKFKEFFIKNVGNNRAELSIEIFESYISKFCLYFNKRFDWYIYLRTSK